MSIKKRATRKVVRRAASFWIVSALVLAACGSQPSATPITPSRPLLVVNPSDGTLFKAKGIDLFKSNDGGQSWETLASPSGAGQSGMAALAINPDDPQMMFAAGVGWGVIRSTDGGQTWQTTNTGLPDTLEVTALALHSFRRETLYAWLKGDGIYRTEDGGANWKRMPDQGPPDKEVRGLAHSTLPGSMNTGWLYASTATGAYLSMDCF